MISTEVMTQCRRWTNWRYCLIIYLLTCIRMSRIVKLDKEYLKKDLNDVLFVLRTLASYVIAKACWRQRLRECNALTAEEFRAEMAGVAFITGLDSSAISQRLLEEDTLSFQSAVTKKLALIEQTHKRASFNLSSNAQSSIAAGNTTSKSYLLLRWQEPFRSQNTAIDISCCKRANEAVACRGWWTAPKKWNCKNCILLKCCIPHASSFLKATNTVVRLQTHTAWN